MSHCHLFLGPVQWPSDYFYSCFQLVMDQCTIAMGVPFISQTHTNLHNIVQMGTGILNFMALSLRTAEGILLLHKSVLCVSPWTDLAKSMQIYILTGTCRGPASALSHFFLHWQLLYNNAVLSLPSTVALSTVNSFWGGSKRMGCKMLWWYMYSSDKKCTGPDCAWSRLLSAIIWMNTLRQNLNVI